MELLIVHLSKFIWLMHRDGKISQSAALLCPADIGVRHEEAPLITINSTSYTDSIRTPNMIAEDEQHAGLLVRQKIRLKHD